MRRGRRVAADLDPLFGSDRGVFEVGIGTGAVAEGLRELGRRVAGLDVGVEMAVRARDRIGPRVVVGDAERLPLRTSSVDDVFAVWLMHLVEVDLVMAEVARVMRPGRRFLVCQGQERTSNPVDEIETEIAIALRDPGPRVPVSKRIVEGAERAGLSLIDRVLGEPQPFGVTPEKAARRIEERSKSFLWDVDDETWEAVVVPAVARIRALPSPDEQIAGAARARIWIFER